MQARLQHLDPPRPATRTDPSVVVGIDPPLSSSRLLTGPSASALHGEPGRDPCFLTLAVLPHVGVAHSRQLTGGLQGSWSRRVPAVEYYLRFLVGEQVWCHLGDFAGRKVQRSG